MLLEELISFLSWKHLGLLQEVLQSAAGEREVWVSLLNLLPLQPDHREEVEDGLKGNDRWMQLPIFIS